MTQAFNLALLANNANASGQLNADTGIYNTVNVANGGTNLDTTPSNGQLLIGNSSGYTLATLTAGTGISVTNAAGSITLTNSQPNAVVDIQTFNAGDADLTWDKPATGQTMVKIQVWGGGGGGARTSSSNSAGGGGGGAYAEFICPISYMGSTATVTVGAAGVGRTTSAGNGTAGGSSSIVVANYPSGSKTIIAYGGGGGGNQQGAGGGGQLGAGGVTSLYNGGKGYASNAFTTFNPQPFSIEGVNPDPTGGGRGLLVSCDAYYPTGSVYGGGGGSFGSYAGAQSLYGGGGGSASGAAGASFYGGNGGANAAGTVPSGGGGTSNTANTNGSNGAAGRVVITSW